MATAEKRDGEQPIHPAYHEDSDLLYSLDGLHLARSARQHAQEFEPGTPEWWWEFGSSIHAGHHAIVSAIHEQTYVLKESIDALREAIERQSGTGV